MKRRVDQLVPYLSFRNNIVTIPGYRFTEAVPWSDTGSSTILAEGHNLKDGSNVIAKIAPAHSNGSLCLDRELHVLGRLANTTEGRVTLSLVECFNIPRDAGDCTVLILLHPGTNELGHYFPPSHINPLLLPWTPPQKSRPTTASKSTPTIQDLEMSDTSPEGLFEHSTTPRDLLFSAGTAPRGGGMEIEQQMDGAGPTVSDGDPEDEGSGDAESWDVMDLASFLEFAVSASHCLETLHKAGIIHREIRPNSFHVNAHSGVVRFAHFGNRSVSLERLGGPSSLVIEVGDLPEWKQRKVKEAMCYLAPEQTGTAETIAEDHRTDLYALGVLFWTLLVGHGRLPFEGSAMELLHSVVQKQPAYVHEVRRDVPEVLSKIVDKLLAKSPDGRYNSAVGLKNDLMECQKRLTLSCASTSTSMELIPPFEIAQHDMFLELTIPTTLYGRERELDVIRSVIRSTSMEHLNSSGPINPHYRSSSTKPYRFSGLHAAGGMSSSSLLGISINEQPATEAGVSNGVTAHHTVESPFGGDGPGTVPTNASTWGSIPNGEDGDVALPPIGSVQPPLGDTHPLSIHRNIDSVRRGSGLRQSPGSSVLQSPTIQVAAGIGPSSLSGTSSTGASALQYPKSAMARSIVACGPAGIGKSSLILANQTNWRSSGLWGYAKMVKGESTPFTGLLSCLSSVLRQLMAFHPVLPTFVQLLRLRLGPQIINIPLLYHEAPELRDILALFQINFDEPKVALSTEELGARFQSLVETVFGAVGDVRPLALFLDDIHFADQSSLDLVGLLANSRSRLLILATCRGDDLHQLTKVRHVFTSKARTTWIELVPLDFNALSALVSTTLQRPKDDVAPLTRLVHRVSMGNPFSARNLLITVRRQGHIWYEWGVNTWQYNLTAIEKTVHAHVSAPTDISFLISHFRELPEEAQQYLIWASIFSPTFKINDIANMLDWDEGGKPDDLNLIQQLGKRKAPSKMIERVPSAELDYSKASMRGLQQVLAQGWLVQRARDMCSFMHDRYRQAAIHMASQLPDITVMKMCLRVAFKLMQETDKEKRDVYRIAEYCRRCIPLIREHPKREGFVDCLVSAAEASAARGAHEPALQAFVSARTLLGEGAWQEYLDRTLVLSLSISELYGAQGNHEASDQLIGEILAHAHREEDRARALRLRSRNKFLQRDFENAFRDTASALRELGVDIPEVVSLKQADAMFDQVKAEILALGFDHICALPKTRNPRTDLIVSLMNDAATNAWWGAGPGFPEWIGVTTINIALREGISPGTGLGFLWCIGGAAERRQLYRFCADIGGLALKIAYDHGGVTEKSRADLLFTAMVSGYGQDHLKHMLPRVEQAIKLARSAGDRIYEGFSQCYSLATRLLCAEHLNDLLPSAEEAVADIRVWTVHSDTNALAISILMTIRALAGETIGRNADTAFDTGSWREANYLQKLQECSGNLNLTMNWYNSFKLVGLHALGYHSRAAELGFEVYKTRELYPSHRHVRFGLFFHSLALVQCLWSDSIPKDQRSRYLNQVQLNQEYLRRWISPSPVNNSTWHALIEAELASYQGKSDAFKLYDTAVKLAMDNDWIMEEGWALYLEGCHFQRQGIEGLGTELQRRGIARHAQWGAYGVVNHLSRTISATSPLELRKPIFSADVGVQTDNTVGTSNQRDLAINTQKRTHVTEDELAGLTAEDLSDVLKWSQVIASDINLTSSLQRLTEIAIENFNAQDAVLAMKTDEGEYTVATSYTPPQPCIVFEQPKSIKKIVDPLKRAVLQHCFYTRERVFFQDVSAESRFAPEAAQTKLRSVICIPMSNNRGQVYGALFLGNHYPFFQNHVSILSLLVRQASISIANALLFKSVQQATKANLQMIQSQRQALEEARKSREDAMKATKIKSNFLASMSHELRTPFSSFYGLLDILGSTNLDTNQRELVQTAQQSCELLLKIIDSILDYSKLEASALKLEPVPFLVEDVVADCVELLLPLASRKLDMAFDIKADVPTWAVGDYSRIRQVLMNLLGNALKFTASGSVQTICSVDPSISCAPGEVAVRWSIKDTGIGLSDSDKRNLWQPFSQADNSSTRRFGGTGLGLSISLSLVKHMRGDIGVESQLGVGSEFWFWIPLKIHESSETKKAERALESICQRLLRPNPLRILASSRSPVTLSLLTTILHGFDVFCVSSFEEAVAWLHGAGSKGQPVDFVLLDHFNAKRLEQIPVVLNTYDSTKDAKAIHLYTPTPITAPASSWGRIPTAAAGGDVDMAVASANGSLSTVPPSEPVLLSAGLAGPIIRMNKPPRRARLLELLGSLRDVKTPLGELPTSQIGQALAKLEAAKPLIGTATVLVAEDNPIANQLLVRQLQRYKVNVFSTTDGEAAFKEWEKREPGFFTFALFDHHMPICDGVEAAKRVRAAEMKKKMPITLPIIALSADCQESTKELCLSAGMNGFLAKPMRPGDLPSLLRTYASNDIST